MVGRTCGASRGEEALAAVGGYTIANDVSMRDYQYKSHQWLAGKAWARSTPLGPFLVTPDEVGDPHALDISLELNGERMQEANTRLFIFDIPTIVATISEFTPLAPGDVVLTGTPSGRRLPARPEGAAARRRPDRGRDRARRAAREHRRRRVNVSVTFDNLGEASDLERGWWPEDEPLGRALLGDRGAAARARGARRRRPARDVLRRGAQHGALPGHAARARRARARGRLPRLAPRALGGARSRDGARSAAAQRRGDARAGPASRAASARRAGS